MPSALVWKVKGKERLEDIRVDGWIILKWILKNRIEGINLAGRARIIAGCRVNGDEQSDTSKHGYFLENL
jgi:hypothetical protein